MFLAAALPGRPAFRKAMPAVANDSPFPLQLAAVETAKNRRSKIGFCFKISFCRRLLRRRLPQTNAAVNGESSSFSARRDFKPAGADSAGESAEARASRSPLRKRLVKKVAWIGFVPCSDTVQPHSMRIPRARRFPEATETESESADAAPSRTPTRFTGPTQVRPHCQDFLGHKNDEEPQPAD